MYLIENGVKSTLLLEYCSFKTKKFPFLKKNTYLCTMKRMQPQFAALPDAEQTQKGIVFAIISLFLFLYYKRLKDARRF